MARKSGVLSGPEVRVAADAGRVDPVQAGFDVAGASGTFVSHPPVFGERLRNRFARLTPALEALETAYLAVRERLATPPPFVSRHELVRAGKVILFDVFSSRRGGWVGVVGRAGCVPDPAGMRCCFPDGEIATPTYIDDTSPTGRERDSVFVLRFRVPDAERRREALVVSIEDDAGNRIGPVELPRVRSRPGHYLSAATLVRDAYRSLPEWIEFHRLVGVEHFFVYDQRGRYRFRTRNALRPYIDRGLVTLLEWDPVALDAVPAPDGLHARRAQMNHCLHRFGELTEWMLFSDVDEYLYPVNPRRRDVLPLLRDCDVRGDVAACRLETIRFRDEGHRRSPRDLVTRNFVRRAADPAGPGAWKSIVKPSLTSLVRVEGVRRANRGTVVVEVPASSYRLNRYPTIRDRLSGPESNDVVDEGMRRFHQSVRSGLDETAAFAANRRNRDAIDPRRPART